MAHLAATFCSKNGVVSATCNLCKSIEQAGLNSTPRVGPQRPLNSLLGFQRFDGTGCAITISPIAFNVLLHGILALVASRMENIQHDPKSPCREDTDT